MFMLVALSIGMLQRLPFLWMLFMIAPVSASGQVDASLGCNEHDNVVAALAICCIAGAFACVLPCGFFLIRAQKRWATSFLDEANCDIRRVDGVIAEKRWTSKEGGASLWVVLEFEAMRCDCIRVPVRARVGVADVFWRRVDHGSIVEVAYHVDNEKDFAIVEELEDRISSPYRGPVHKAITCFLCCFVLIGVMLASASLPLTGCSLGLAAFFGIVSCGAGAGHAIIFPLGRMVSQSSFFVSTSGSPTPSEALDRLALGRSRP